MRYGRRGCGGVHRVPDDALSGSPGQELRAARDTYRGPLQRCGWPSTPGNQDRDDELPSAPAGPAAEQKSVTTTLPSPSSTCAVHNLTYFYFGGFARRNANEAVPVLHLFRRAVNARLTLAT